MAARKESKTKKKYEAHYEYTRKTFEGESPFGAMTRLFKSTRSMLENFFPQYGALIFFIKSFLN